MEPVERMRLRWPQPRKAAHHCSRLSADQTVARQNGYEAGSSPVGISAMTDGFPSDHPGWTVLCRIRQPLAVRTKSSRYIPPRTNVSPPGTPARWWRAEKYVSARAPVSDGITCEVLSRCCT